LERENIKMYPRSGRVADNTGGGRRFAQPQCPERTNGTDGFAFGEWEQRDVSPKWETLRCVSRQGIKLTGCAAEKGGEGGA